MSEEEKEEIITMCNDIYEGGDWQPMINYIEKLQKENKELKEDNSHQWEERCRLTFELERLQKENEELEKTIEQSLIEQKERDKYTHELEQKLEEKEKVIKLMLEEYTNLARKYIFDNGLKDFNYCVEKPNCDNNCENCIREYIRKKAEK